MADDTNKHYSQLLIEFEEFLNKKLAPTSVYVYMSVIKNFLLQGNKIDNVGDYHKFVYTHTRKNRSSHYYDIMIKFLKWVNIPKNKKKEILNYIKRLR